MQTRASRTVTAEAMRKPVAPATGMTTPHVLQHLLRSGAIQAKLTVSQPGDPLEQEADQVADEVMRMPAASTPLSAADPGIQRKCSCSDGPQEEEKKIQTKEVPGRTPSVTPRAEAHIGSLRGGGQPLPDSVLSFFEPRFGRDFSDVRIHSDSRANEAASAVQARAFTLGKDIIFGVGEYTPHSEEGQRLLAHELAHIKQQDSAPLVIQRKPDETKAMPRFTGDMVYDLIKKRDPKVAELITRQSIDLVHPKEPPSIIEAEPPPKGEAQHVWKVYVSPQPGLKNSSTETGETKTKRVNRRIQVTHSHYIRWALPLQPREEFLKQSQSDADALALEAANSLFHELLHTWIKIEKDPNWVSEHSLIFQDYIKIFSVADSPALAAQKELLLKKIGEMGTLGGKVRSVNGLKYVKDTYYEFLLHEKYDADKIKTAFGRTYTNSEIAQKYGEEVSRSLGTDKPIFKAKQAEFIATIKAMYDKVDQQAAANPSATKPQREVPPQMRH